MIELHVWGPAFGLPSIDAHCLAAIAYMQQAVPRGKWQLVASSDPALSPTHTLPALRDGDIWIGGFRNIFHYVAQISAGEWVLDAGLPEQEGADCIAFSSFVESHGQPLLDLSLYVSSQNYTEITRPLYNKIQPFPLPYLTPPAVRAAAKIRTEHLGLSSLDIDTEDNDASTEPSIIPQSLRRPRQTVSSMLASAPETNAQIRLDALATDFFEPMQALRRKKQFFVSDSQFSSLDCLALGYMALMLTPELPQPWLAKTMQAKFPGLCKWTEELKVEVYGKERTTLEDASPVATTDADLDARLKRLRGRGHLPWMPPYNRDAISVGSVFLSSLAGSIPVVGQLSKNTRTKQHGKPSQNETQGTSWQYWGLAGSLITTLGLVGGYMFQQGLLSLPGEKPEKQRSVGLGAFGEAGEALGLYANQLDAAAQQQRMLEQSQGEPIVEIEVERDGISSTERLS